MGDSDRRLGGSAKVARFLAAAVVAGGLAGLLASAGCTGYDYKTSIRNALDSHPDVLTVNAMSTLADALTSQEYDYLQNLDWSRISEATALADPVFRKALVALGANEGGPGPSTNAVSGRIGTTREALSGDVFADVLEIMQECYGADPGKIWNCNGPACPAAVLAARLKVSGPTIGSPPKVPQTADLGTWSCTTTYGQGSSPSSSCDYRGFCSRETIEFPKNGAPCELPGCYKCDDDNFQPGPNPTRCVSPPGLNTGSSGGGACDLAGIAELGRVNDCGCTIGSAHYDRTIADPGSSTGGHWCCQAYSTYEPCGQDNTWSCFYVEQAPDGNGCCADHPTQMQSFPPGCNDTTQNPDYPASVRDTYGHDLCCGPNGP